jgi:hypothetical protein
MDGAAVPVVVLGTVKSVVILEAAEPVVAIEKASLSWCSRSVTSGKSGGGVLGGALLSCL